MTLPNHKAKVISMAYQPMSATQPVRMGILYDLPDVKDRGAQDPEWFTRDLHRVIDRLAAEFKHLTTETILGDSYTTRDHKGREPLLQGLTRPDMDLMDQAFHDAMQAVYTSGEGRGFLYSTDIIPIMQRLMSTLIEGHTMESLRAAAKLNLTDESTPEDQQRLHALRSRPKPTRGRPLSDNPQA